MRRASVRSVRTAFVLLAALTVAATACHSGKARTSTSTAAASTPTSPGHPLATTTTTAALGPAIVFSAASSEIAAYATTLPFTTQTVVHSPVADQNGVDVSGQICFDPTNPRQFVAVDRTDAADGQQGWGVFTLSGSSLGKLSAKETARLVPTFQPSTDPPAPFGCAFLPDGRLLTTDSGNRSTGVADGQLVEWFPPFDSDTVLSCKVSVTLAAPEGVLVDGDRVLVAESRGNGVTDFVTSTLPTSNLATGGCADRDALGSALAVGVVHSAWLQNAGLLGLTRPAFVARASDDVFYVSSPRTGVIAQVDAAGRFVRRVLVPPAGSVLGPRPFVTGTPMGLGVVPDGTLYYADSGLVVQNGKLVAGLRTGTIRRITFLDGKPQLPVVLDSGLESPDGIGIWIPSR